MKTILSHLLLLALFCLNFGHANSQEREFLPKQPDYGDSTQWYVSQRGAKADIFYIISTETGDYTTANGLTAHHADTYRDSLRAPLYGEMLGVDKLVSGSLNYFSPYYRQCSMQSFLSDSLQQARMPLALGDVRRAFNYYLAHQNQGRPFIIAGFSQGAIIMLQLLEEMSDETYGRMIAAYAIGAPISKQQLSRLRHLKPAQWADDTGVIICYNSVGNVRSAMWESCIGINPVNWRTDTVAARLITEPSPLLPISKQRKDTMSVSFDPSTNMTIVEGYRANDYMLPLIGKKGNYHSREIWLYRDQLRENMALRANAFIKKKLEAEAIIPFDIDDSPVDAHATQSAKELYAFLRDNFGKKTISGMMLGDMSSANGDITQHDDIKAFFDAAGKYPTLVGLDFLFATGRSEANDWNRQYTAASIALAKDTWKRGGMPIFCWHWRDPSRATDEFYTDKCPVKISDAMNDDGEWNTSSTLYKNIVKDIHTIADYFLELQEAGVACLFRPLHEASGGWFWWGREDGAKCCKLWQLIYDEMTRVKGVHNVIWVWNGGPKDVDWLPDASTYDIASTDIYNADFDYSSNHKAFDKLRTLTGGKKILALAENGPIPDIDREFAEGAVWSFWMPWYQTWNGRFINKTSREQWKKVMNDRRVISIDTNRRSPSL